MLKLIFLSALIVGATACNNENKTEPAPTTSDVDTTQKVSSKPAEVLPDLPAYVIFNNWEMGNPGKSEVVVNVYKAWDGNNIDTMASYFGDSAIYDFPDGTRRMTTNKTIEATFRRWRHAYKETSNIPFSLVSLYSKDRDQEWVIAWTWNKWRNTDGTRDSMLYCDNWKFKEGKIIYLNSLQNRASKALTRAFNEQIPR